MALKLRNLNVNLPFGLGGATIEITKGQAKAAWALYIEMATRVVTQDLKKGEGSVREALNSMYTLFDTTRSVLREAGPDAASGHDSIGPIAIRILNEGIRPQLVKWHTSLSDFEASETLRLQEELGPNSKIVVDETRWQDYELFYEKLVKFQQGMQNYLDILAEIAGIKKSD